jgi:cytochrome P450
MTDLRQYDLYSQDFARYSYEIFTQIRQKNPIFSQPGFDGHTPIWFVSRYKDVEAMLRDDRRFVLDFRLAMDPAQIAQIPSEDRIMGLVNNHLPPKRAKTPLAAPLVSVYPAHQRLAPAHPGYRGWLADQV